MLLKERLAALEAAHREMTARLEETLATQRAIEARLLIAGGRVAFHEFEAWRARANAAGVRKVLADGAGNDVGTARGGAEGEMNDPTQGQDGDVPEAETLPAPTDLST